MANVKISELNELEEVENSDLLVIVDSSANETKKVKVENININTGKSMGSIVVDDINYKNLFSGIMYNGIINQSGAYITNNARITNTTSNGFYLPAGTYTLSIADLDACTIVIKNASGTVIQDLADSWKTLPFTFTTTQDGYICFSAKKNNDATLDPNDYAPQLEKGSTATSYIKGKKIIKEQDGYVKESTTFYANDFKCKNMFIPTLTNEGVSIAKNNCNLSLVNDEYTFVATGSDMYFGQVTTQNTAYASNKGTLYDVEGLSSISFTITNPLFTTNFITAYDSSKNSLGYTLFNTNTGTYTIPAGAKYITLRAGKNDAVSGTTYKAKIQLEVGSATPYTPYKNFDNTPIITQLLSDTSPSAGTSYSLSDNIENYKYIMIVMSSGALFPNSRREYIPVEQLQINNNDYRIGISLFQSATVYMFLDLSFDASNSIRCNTKTQGTTGWSPRLKVYGIK